MDSLARQEDFEATGSVVAKRTDKPIEGSDYYCFTPNRNPFDSNPDKMLAAAADPASPVVTYISFQQGIPSSKSIPAGKSGAAEIPAVVLVEFNKDISSDVKEQMIGVLKKAIPSVNIFGNKDQVHVSFYSQNPITENTVARVITALLHNGAFSQDQLEKAEKRRGIRLDIERSLYPSEPVDKSPAEQPAQLKL